MIQSEFLALLSEELRTQDNRCTAEPLFVVQQERRIYGMDSCYADNSEWIDADGELSGGSDEVREYIKEAEEIDTHPNLIDPEDHGYTRVYYTSYWDFVTAHFTEKAALRYLKENRHNLNNPRVFVTSQRRCEEWNAVVSILKDEQW